MIITTKKPIKELVDKLKNVASIYLVGCNACATKCQTGGQEQINLATKELQSYGLSVCGSFVLDTACDARLAKRDLCKDTNFINADAVLVFACGGGVQTVGLLTEKMVLPALDSVFVGALARLNTYNEYCVLCGECILDKTFGICPISRCAKSLLNGPCGGVVDGKCEIDPQKDCAWYLIYQKAGKVEGGLLSLKNISFARSNNKQRKLSNSKEV